LFSSFHVDFKKFGNFNWIEMDSKDQNPDLTRTKRIHFCLFPFSFAGRLSSIGKMDARIYRRRADSPEDTGVERLRRISHRKAHGILKVWPLRRGVCEFCVKYTMRARERRVAPFGGPSAEYPSFNRRKNIATVRKVSTAITFICLKAWDSLLLKVVLITDHTCHHRQRK